MRSVIGCALGMAVTSAALLAGCSSGPSPQPQEPPSSTAPPANPSTGFTRIVSGAGDSVGAQPGSPTALYKYRFRQIDPASDRFTFQDRDLSFYFKPTPDALHFQVENRQNRPVWIDWERSTFVDPFGKTGKIAHASTTWRDRFGVQAPTQIVGLQVYGDYLLPLDYLVDPAGSGQQLHRTLFPEDTSAPQYDDRTFGADLVFRVENSPRSYSFRFKVSAVVPR